ncbi:uncharacterized protein [Cherax quadricarinatus]|uniref:uncharacterized protein n=1 Tax=Cherax quadricarinatus TaxID=27406 RepID=UPI00387E2464
MVLEQLMDRFLETRAGDDVQSVEGAEERDDERIGSQLTVSATSTGVVTVVEVAAEVHCEASPDQNMDAESVRRKRAAMHSDSDDVLTLAQRLGKKSWADVLTGGSFHFHNMVARCRVNTVCIELTREAVLGPSTALLLPAIICDTYGIANEDLYGVAMNDVSWIFVKFCSAHVYEEVVDKFQEVNLVVNSAVSVKLHDVSHYYTCRLCAECKPNFHQPEKTHLIKSTQPFERLNIDFKGPPPSINQNRYFLNIVDEYSRFPFVFPCANVAASTVISCLSQLFSIFGMPAYIHSDRGSSFMSNELQEFLASKGIACSRTTSYNPQGNGQVEQFNGTIWKAVTMTLKSCNLPVEHWQTVLPDALHSIRSLLCTATNATPHERLLDYSCRSSTGASVPHWLCHPGPVLLKSHRRMNKTDPLVEEVELLQANPHYAYIRYQNGEETTVSIRHLAPVEIPISVVSQDTPINVKNASFSPGKPLETTPTEIEDSAPAP